MAKRVTVVQAGGNDQKLVNISTGMSMGQFLEQVSTKLDINAKRIFAAGVEIDELDVVRDGDVLTITEGGPLNAKGKKAKSTGPQTIKIAVIGSGGVGKSAVTLQYVQGRFVMEYDPTIEDAYRKQVQIDGQTCFLDILDTAGQEDYVALRGQWMQDRNGFILVYSVVDRRSLEDLEVFYNQLCQIHEVPPPLVILGNKCDMVDERAVQTFEGEALAKTFANAAFFESSAKQGINIEAAFTTLVRNIRKRQGPPQKQRICQIL